MDLYYKTFEIMVAESGEGFMSGCRLESVPWCIISQRIIKEVRVERQKLWAM